MRIDVKVNDFAGAIFALWFSMRIDVKVNDFVEGDFRSVVFHDD